MLARFVLGVVTAGSVVLPAMAGQMMSADEARRFVAGRVFAFTCFDGTRGAGRIFDDGGAGGSVQFSGAGPIRHMRLPGNTIQVRGRAVCASLKGVPFEPCFNLVKTDERSFQGSVSGMGFAYCNFSHQGASQMLLARAVARPRSLRAPMQGRSVEASKPEMTAGIETPRVESAEIAPVKAEAAKSDPVKAEPAKSEPVKTEGASELRRSTD